MMDEMVEGNNSEMGNNPKIDLEKSYQEKERNSNN